MMDEFLSLNKNTVDLLCVGSSHAYTSCDTEVYWNDFGIPAFCISGPSQPAANSYYYIREAFKTQTPKVVLLEASCLYTAFDTDEYRSVNNIAWMPYSENRANALRDTVIDKTLKSNLEWNISYFHNRWAELNNRDFEYVLKNDRPSTKGFDPWWNYADYEDSLVVWDTEYKVEPSEESIKYVNDIISFCQQQNVKLVVYLSPHYMDEGSYGQINWYREHFKQYGVEILDGIQLSRELDIDPDIDMCNNHIAYAGAVKLSAYIGNYLSDKGYVTDRREDQGYEAWEKWSHYYENTAGIYSLANIKDLAAYLQELGSLDNNIAIIAYSGELENDQVDIEVLNVMDSNGLYIEFGTEVSPYIGILANGKVIEQLQTPAIGYKETIMDHQIEIDINEEKRVNILVDYDRLTTLNQIMDENAVRIYVYDCISGEVVENRIFYPEL